MTLDPRTHAFDPDLRRADAALRGRLDGGDWTYYTPEAVCTGPARLRLRAEPREDSAQVNEALPGEALERLWAGPDGWVYVRTLADGYPGWALEDGLVGPGGSESVVTALRAHAYAAPRISAPIRAELCLGARVAPTGETARDSGDRLWHGVTLPGGEAAWMAAPALSPLPDADAAALALRFLGTPYVWGGRSAWGLDCSGLTQLVYAAFGRAIPRDADQQQEALQAVEAPERGDLAFFPGHVGLMLDGRRMVHANATHMAVSVETLGEGGYGARLLAELTGYGRWGGA